MQHSSAPATTGDADRKDHPVARNLRFYTWNYRDSCGGDFYDGTLELWLSEDPTDGGSRQPAYTVTFGARALTTDPDTGRWGRPNFNGEFEPRSVSSLCRPGEQHSAPSGFYAPAIELPANPDSLRRAARLCKRIDRTIETYNLRFRYPHDRAAQFVAALDKLGAKYIRYDSTIQTFVEDSKLLW